MLEDVDIVLTTYHTLVADFREKPIPLHEVDWFRVVLDEGKENHSLASPGLRLTSLELT